MGLYTFSSATSDWLTPAWAAPPQVRAVFTTRNGGVSVPPYDSMNLGSHVGDALERVQRNRHTLSEALGAHPVFLDQVHGNGVLSLQPDSADGQQADAAWCTTPGLACTVMVADCLPVLLCHADGSAVSAAHAGWRGLLGQQGVGVLERVAHQHRGQDTLAWLGPCIGPSAFEVGAEVRQAFVEQNPVAAACFAPGAPGKWLADLSALARQRLQALGITQIYGNDGSAPWCTVGNPSRFFSYRRDGLCGRMAACIWRAA
jgi:YfiH family protein